MRKNKMVMALSVMLLTGTAAFAAPQPGAGATTSVQLKSGVPAGAEKITALSAMVGKRVLGKSREFLGTLVSVDEAKKTAQMKIPTGAVVSLPTDKLNVEEDHVRAATVSRGDVLVLVRETGQQGTLEAGVLPNPFK